MRNRLFGIGLALLLVSVMFVGLVDIAPSAAGQADEGSIRTQDSTGNQKAFFWGADELVYLAIVLREEGNYINDQVIIDFESDIGDTRTDVIPTGAFPVTGRYNYSVWLDMGHYTAKMYRDANMDWNLDDGDPLMDTTSFTVGGIMCDQ